MRQRHRFRLCHSRLRVNSLGHLFPPDITGLMVLQFEILVPQPTSLQLSRVKPSSFNLVPNNAFTADLF